MRRRPYIKNLVALVAIFLVLTLSWGQGLAKEPGLDQDAWSAPWQELTFEASKTLTRILVRVELHSGRGYCPYPIDILAKGFMSCPLKDDRAMVISEETVTMSLIFPQKKYEHFVWFDPLSLDAIERVRWKKSGSRWIKLYKWQAKGVARLAIRPGDASEDLPPFKWKRRYSSFYRFGKDVGSVCGKGQGVSEPLVLVYLASRLGEARQLGERTLCVFGKKVLHRCKIEGKGEESVKVRYLAITPKGKKKVKERKKVLVYSVRPVTLEASQSRTEPFSLLGLKRNIEIFVEAGTGIPVRIRGDNDVMGHIDLRLVEARFKGL
ncbi:MAG: hypothetical protein GXO58_10795 [Thermodesulfobacteria bacterium]|nr:hypothetical protein [Thermodesulfobacteriota bacterium]